MGRTWGQGRLASGAGVGVCNGMQIITRPRLIALLAAVLGSGVFVWLRLPIPLLLGPMLGCLVFALAGARLQGMGQFGTLMRTVLGVAIGASITPEFIGDLPEYAPTLLIIPIFIVVIGTVGYLFFRRIMKFDHPTSFYSAMPGGLQDMLVFGQEAGGDVRAMSLIHATRVLVIVSVAPFFLTLVYDLDLNAAPGARAAGMDPVQLILLCAAAVIGWKAGERVGLFGASIMGPMILTAALSLAGIITVRPPAEMIWVAQFFIGISVGANYSGITGREMRIDVGAGLAYSVLLAILSLAIIELVVLVSPADNLDVILSFLPGGQAEMVIIALVAGADIAFVVAHHLLRVILVIMLAPVFARWLDR